MGTIHEKLIAIQKELKAPKGQYNGFGKYKYRSCEDILEAVKPLLAKNGCYLTLTDEIEYIGNRFYIRAIATISDGEEKVQVSALAREEETKKGMDGSQITGTASSYARKYALNGLFCIDDTKDADANEYSNQINKASAKKTNSSAPNETLASSETKNKLVEMCKANGNDIHLICQKFKLDNNSTETQFLSAISYVEAINKNKEAK